MSLKGQTKNYEIKLNYQRKKNSQWNENSETKQQKQSRLIIQPKKIYPKIFAKERRFGSYWNRIQQYKQNRILENIEIIIPTRCWKNQKSKMKNRIQIKQNISPLTWGCKIPRLHLCGGVRPPPHSHTPTSVLNMTVNHLMAKLQPWKFGDVENPFIAIAPWSTVTWW